MSDETTGPDLGAKEAGDEPTADEAAAAERAAEQSDDVSDDYRDMTERGANAEGEGKID